MTKLLSAYKKSGMKNLFYCTHVLLLFCLLLCFSGCASGPKVVSYDELSSDLYHSLSKGIVTEVDGYEHITKLSPSYEVYQYSDLTIEKRQTSVENKIDTIYVSATLVNAAQSSADQEIQYSGNFILTYILYNEGWMLDEVIVEDFRYIPLQSAEFTAEELTNALEYCGYKNISNFAVTNREDDLENKVIEYHLTAECQYTYVTEHIDIKMCFYFSEDGWNPNNVYIGETTVTESDWHIAGRFDVPDKSDDLILGAVGSIETLSVEYIDQYNGFGETESNINIYKVGDTSFKHVMGDFFEGVNPYDAEYIAYYDFSIKLQGDFTNCNSFVYVVWWNGGGNRFDGMLFIGKDKLGYFWGDDYEIDEYHRRVVVYNTVELIPQN